MNACEIDWSLLGNVMSGFGSLVGAAFTILLFFLASKELKRNNLIAEGDLYFRIKQDFDTEFSRKVHGLVISNRMIFHKDTVPESVRVSDNETYPLTHFTYSYLGSFEDLSFFHEKGLMSLDVLDAGFGYMILETGNSKVIFDIIQHLRNGKEKDNSIYIGFENLYKKIRDTLNEDQKKLYRKDFNDADFDKPMPNPNIESKEKKVVDPPNNQQ